MEVREAQRQGALALLFLGLVVYGVSRLTLFTPSQGPRLPWINQESESFVLEIGGNSEKAGIYFFPPSANLAGVLRELGVDDVVSPDHLREAFVNADAAVKLVMEQEGAGLVAMAAVRRLALGLPINLNRATEEELTAVPGIGSKTAAQISKLRRARGGIRSLAELAELPGINERKLKVLKDYLMAGNVGEGVGGQGKVALGGNRVQ